LVAFLLFAFFFCVVSSFFCIIIKTDKQMSEEWISYDSFITAQLAENDSKVGGFAIPLEEFYWNILSKAAMPRIEDARLLTLPLHIHLIRGKELGSDITFEECYNILGPQLNSFWALANISFDIVNVTEHDWPEEIKGKTQTDIKSQIWDLARDPATGRMAGKDTRREIFLTQLIGSSNLSPASYDIWLFDLIGQASQGCCIDRQSRTIIMGRRSTKGYLMPTRRPLACLAKTMAHELGHALGLNHPKGRHFKDGTSCVAATGKNNLMIGGVDLIGGGGNLLCPWQVLLARQHAVDFMTAYTNRTEEEQVKVEVGEENGDVIVGKDSIKEIVETKEATVTQMTRSEPIRTVMQLDALEWLKEFPDEQLPGEVFTSVPDISELHSMFPSPQKNNQHYSLYKEWFQQTIALVLSKTPRYAIFLQTDIRALTGKDDKVLEFIDKSALIQEVATTSHFTLVWHKIVTNSERFSQKRVSHAPNWSHLICLRRDGVSCYETRNWKTPDVFTRGDMTWERAVGLNAAMTGVSFLKHMAQTSTVVDPFCGLGTILAVANALDLDAVGNDLSRKRAKRARELDLRFALCSVPYKQREHHGVTERLAYTKDTVPKPFVWNSGCHVSDADDISTTIGAAGATTGSCAADDEGEKI
jgi:hypothetical protein